MVNRARWSIYLFILRNWKNGISNLRLNVKTWTNRTPCVKRLLCLVIVVQDLNLKLWTCIVLWPFISSQILVNNQPDALFHVFTYSFHLSTRFEHHSAHHQEFECINTSSGMISLCKWLFGMLVRHTKQSLTYTNHTRWCINTIRPPDDEHCDARNV
jgi:hypothetical protein